MEHDLASYKRLLSNYKQLQEKLFNQLNRYIFLRQIRILTIGSLLSISCLLIITTIFLLFERSTIQHELFRWLFAVALYSCLVVSVTVLIKNLYFKPNYTTAALEIEKFNSDYNYLLSTAAELEANKKLSSISSVFRKLTVANASEKLQNDHLYNAVSSGYPILGTVILFICSFFIISLWYLFSPYEVLHGVKRILNPFTLIPPFTSVSFTIEPGNITIAKGENVIIKAITNNIIQNEPILNLSSNIENSQITSIQMIKDNTASISTYFYTLHNVSQSIKYQVQYQKYISEEYSITAIERPEIKTIQAIIHHPSYISNKPENLPINQCDISAVIGSKVEIYGEASQKISSASLYFENIGTLSCSIASDSHFSANFEVSTSTYFTIYLTNEYNISNINPVKYKVTALTDASPTVTIIKPASDVSYPKSKRLDIRVQAKDDFGITTTLLYYSTESRRNFIPLSMKPDRTPIKEYEVEYPWLLDTINVIPGTIISYFVYVEDSKQPNPNIATTSKYYVSMPSAYDKLAGTYKTHDEVINDLKKYSEIQKMRKDQMEAIYQKIKHEGKIDHLTENELEQTIKELDTQIKKSQEMLEKFMEISNNLRQNPLTNPQILEKLQKIHDLFNEVLDDEAKKLKEQLSKALEEIKVDPKEIEKFYNNFSIDDFVTKLDKTIDILQKVKDEMKMYSIGKAIEDLKQRQEQISSTTSEIIQQLNNNANNSLTENQKNLIKELAQQQDKIASDLQQLEEEAKQIIKDKPKVGNETHPALEDIKNLSDMLKNLDYIKTTDEIKQSLNNNNLQDALGMQKKMLRFLESLQKHGEQICKNCMRMGSFSIKADFTNFIKKSLNISQNQELLYIRLQNMPFNFLRGQQPEVEEVIDDVSIYQLLLKNEAYRLEKELENYMKVDLLLPQDLSKKIKDTQNIFANIIKDLEDRSIGNARIQQKRIIQKYNELALDLIKLQEDVNSSVSPSDSTNHVNFLQQFKELTKRQLNLYQKNLERLSSQDKNLLQELMRMSLEQRFIRESLQQLLRDVQNQTKLLGRMDDIISDMKDIETQILDPNQQRKVAEKQKTVYEKMLRAQKSLKRTEDENEERKAERPSENLKQLPTDIQLPTLNKDLQDYSKDFLSDLKEDYPKSYEKYLNDYFKSLSFFGGLNETKSNK